MMTHLQLPLDPAHFERWLALFAQTAQEDLPPATAANIIAKSERIASNFRQGIANHRDATDLAPGIVEPGRAQPSKS